MSVTAAGSRRTCSRPGTTRRRGGDRRLRRARRPTRAARDYVPAGRAGRGLRQRRHALVREADADRARLHPRSGSPRWPRPTPRCATGSRGRRRTSKDYAWLGDVITKHYHGDDSDVKVLMGGILQAFAGMTVEEYAARGRRVPPQAHAPDASAGLLRDVRLPADGRAAALPGGERLHDLHRLRRRPRLHAAGDRRDLRHPARARHRQLHGARLPRGRARRHRSSTRRRWTSSTTAR